ncbi:MAG: hypothetical protein LBH01_07610 [Verrucomicrobiales bacterium]|jgi:hypothetical protein|nr:hypothetical protein [Verrucomicrobiales bacterium]
MNYHQKLHSILLAALLLCGAVTMAQSNDNLLKNGNLEEANAEGTWAANWPKDKVGGVTWETEDGNHFLRFTQKTPGEMILLYTNVTFPKEAKKVKLSYRVRYSNVVAGEQAWFDARFMMKFMDAPWNGKEIKPGPKVPNFKGDSNGWQEKSQVIDIPEGAKALAFMPCLFKVESGTMDIDDISFTVVTDQPAQ